MPQLKVYIYLLTICILTVNNALMAAPTETTVLTPDPIAGKAKSEKCVACHNADGNSTVVLWPKIAGQHQAYLFHQLLSFQQGANGGRNEPSMFAMMQDLSQQDLADLSAFYAKQTMSAGTTKANLVALGQALYRGGNVKTGIPACAACHGASGMGNELAHFPRIAGQHAEYTANQLNNYKKKTRTNDINGIMQDIASRLSDAEIEAISSYVEGLHAN